MARWTVLSLPDQLAGGAQAPLRESGGQPGARSLTGRERTCTVNLYVLEESVPTETTYTAARANLAALCERASSNRDEVIIHRRGAEDVALISAEELRSLKETAHLLRSRENARRLMAALARARRRRVSPRPVAKLRREIGLGSPR